MNQDDTNLHHHGDDALPVVDEQAEAALDELLLQFGNDYNRPPDLVPREEMWNEIRLKSEPPRVVWRHRTWSTLAAAALLLGAGISIGVEAHSRLTRGAAPLAGSPEHASVAAKPPTATLDSAPEVVTSRPGRALAASPRSFERRDTHATSTVAEQPNGAARNTAYTLATVRHFAAVEALLTSYKTSPEDAKADAQMAAWARSLLSQTRLLLDSPAAKDPMRNKLLQDLELVLVQMTQLSTASTPLDREMIQGSVRHSDVITRLRTAVPAGASTSL